jgi:Uma2 family endonuclease
VSSGSRRILDAVATEAIAHRFDAATYGRVVASGALQDQRVELIDGEILDMGPNSPRHVAVIERLMKPLTGSGARLRVQMPLQVADDSVPEPDLALVEGELSFERHPTTALLVVEVVLSSLALDRGRKSELYAGAGVPVCWVVDVESERVYVAGDPQPTGGYGTIAIHRRGDTLPAPAHGVDPIAVDRLFA